MPVSSESEKPEGGRESLRRLHVRIQGRVQGVNFRYATRARAMELGLTGWVRNLPDGRVEATFEGKDKDLQAVLGWCRKGPPSARVEDVEVSWYMAQATFHGFAVKS